MSQIKNFKKKVEKAKRKFPSHQLLHVVVRDDASTPYELSFFHKIIADSKNPKWKHKDFSLYIHDYYLTIRGNGFTFEPVVVELHDELWVELYKVFDLPDDEVA